MIPSRWQQWTEGPGHGPGPLSPGDRGREPRVKKQGFWADLVNLLLWRPVYRERHYNRGNPEPIRKLRDWLWRWFS